MSLLRKPLVFEGDVGNADAARPAPAQDGPAGEDRRRYPRVRLDDLAPANEGEQPADTGAERRRHPRMPLDPPAPEPARSSYNGPERRQRDRRSIDALRAEVQWTSAPEPRNRGISALGRIGIKPNRILLIAIALLSGALAAFMAIQNTQPTVKPAAAAVTQVVREARTRVLIAKQPISIGQRLTPATLAWVEWPEGAVLSDYITAEAAPDALDNMTDAVARFDFFEGDPIRENKLVRASDGYLSAILESGKRGVSLAVSADAASGGFINPNDRVDVVLTRQVSESERSETILHNVRVMAIDTRLGEKGAPEVPVDPEDPRAGLFLDQAIVTLELDATEAEVAIGAAALGRLSLVLRSMLDFAEAGKEGLGGANQAIRISSPFWAGETSDRPR